MIERYVRFENVSYSLALVLVAFCEIVQVLLNLLTKKENKMHMQLWYMDKRKQSDILIFTE